MTRRALVLFALMSVIWGIPYLFIRVAVAEVTPATLVFARTAIATLILLPIALVRLDLRPVLARWRWVLAFAVVEVAGPWVLLGSAEQHVTSSLAGLLVAGVPLVGMLVAVTTGGRDRLGGIGVAGLLLGLAGVAGIVGFDLDAADPVSLVQIGLVVIGYAVGPAILARRLDGLPSLGVMAVTLAISAVGYAPVAILQWPSTVPSPGVLVAVVVLGVVCTALAFILFGALIEAVGPVRATVITYVNPAVAALLGVAVLAEPITLPMIIGFCLVLLGSVLATRRPGSPAGATSSANEAITADAPGSAG